MSILNKYYYLIDYQFTFLSFAGSMSDIEMAVEGVAKPVADAQPRAARFSRRSKRRFSGGGDWTFKYPIGNGTTSGGSGLRQQPFSLAMKIASLIAVVMKFLY